MARLARVVVPGFPHHVTQRGNRRQLTFFCDGDYEIYLGLMAQWCWAWGVEVWAYCLMPNHVHLIVVPESEEGLCRAIGEAHRRYTRHVNFREGWRGAPVAGKVCVVCDGGGIPAGGSTVCGDESCTGSVGEGAGAVSLE